MKIGRWFLIAALSAVSVATLTLAACTGGGESLKEKPPVAEEPALTAGEEAGVYYFDASDGEYLVTLSGMGQFTLTVGGESKAGVYTLADGALSLDFSEDEDGTASAQLSGSALTLTYGEHEWRFLKRVNYTVSFNAMGGSDVASVSVVNGRTLARPADPVYANHTLIGWCTDEALTKTFAFGSDIVTENMTLYAYWVETPSGRGTYTIDFDLGEEYTGAQAPDAMTTLGGRLYDVPSVSMEGYTFGGWWVSMYDDGNKLSYAWTQDTVFTEDTTLYAVWYAQGEGSLGLAVGESAITWNRLSAAGTLTVEGPQGFAGITREVGASSIPTQAFDLASLPAGDYTVTLTSGGVTQTLHYKNKALARVSHFTVMEPSILVFDGVENAEGYYITVDCGNDQHNHTYYSLGTVTNYNFGYCSMQPGGITFTVTAVAEGYASSVSRTFTVDRTLGAVTGLSVVDEEVVWNAVTGATNYVVSVNGNEVDNGTATRFSLKAYAAGELEIAVSAHTAGYNPSTAATTYTKTTLAAPSGVSVNGMVLSWAEVAGASSYEVSIGDVVASVTGTSYDLSEADIAWSTGSDYAVSVRALGENSSLWSEPVSVRYAALPAALSYSANTISWRPVMGAKYYLVRVNGGNAIQVSADKTSAQITLTRAGVNTVSVSFFDGVEESERVSLDVFAYEVTFDAREGLVNSGSGSTFYLATGDSFTFPGVTRNGYQLAGWYNTPGGASTNGAVYTGTTFTETRDIVLYAYWTPRTYTVTLNYGAYGTGSVTTQEVTFGQPFTLPVPAFGSAGVPAIFMGWSNSTSLNGTMYTDEAGTGKGTWTYWGDITLHAVYVEALQFEEQNDGSYLVRAGEQIRYFSNLTIPDSYNSKPVTYIPDQAFYNCTSLTTVSIPDTVKTINSGAFEGCSNITSFTVYDSALENDPVYSSSNGVLIYTNTNTGAVELSLVPAARTGRYIIPETVTTLVRNTFSGSALGEVIIPSSVTSIQSGAFNNCANLTAITFEEGGDAVLTMASDAIAASCTKLTTLTLPARLAEFKGEVYEVFRPLTSLTSIAVVGSHADATYSTLDGILYADNGRTLLFCPSGKEGELEIPSSVTSIASYAFAASSNAQNAARNGITKVTFASTLVEVDDHAFWNATALKEVVFKENTADGVNVKLTIGAHAFDGCTNLSKVTFEETLADGSFTISRSCGVIGIGDYAFANTAITSVLLPQTLESIGAYAFSNTALTDIDFTHVSSKLVYGARCFANNRSLTSLTFPDNVGAMAFNDVFYGCNNLKEFNISDSNKNYWADEYGVIYNRDGTELLYFPEYIVGTYTIPSTVTSIGGGAFERCQKLENFTSIHIPASVTSIGANAFAGCQYLTSVIFDEGGTALAIGEGAFANCPLLTSMELPAHLTSLGSGCFSGTKITSITLKEGESPLTIGESAFSGLDITSISIPANTVSIGANAFDECDALVSVTFPQTMDGDLTMGSKVFANTRFTSIALPEGLVSVPENAFLRNGALEQVSIPSTVRNSGEQYAIGAYAFEHNTALSTVTFALGGTQPLSIAANAFRDCTSLTSLTLPSRLAAFTSNSYDVFGTASDPNPNYLGAAFGDINGIAQAPIAEINVADESIADFTPSFWSEDGVLYGTVGGTAMLVYCPVYKTGTVTVSSRAQSIRNGAFYGCSRITAIDFDDAYNADGLAFTLPDCTSVTASQSTDLIFWGCTQLLNIDLPARLTSIGNYALSNGTTSGFRYISFADGCKLTAVGDGAFYGARVSSFTFPTQVATVGEDVFEECSSLRTVTISEVMDVASANNIIASVHPSSFNVPAANPNFITIGNLIFDNQMSSIVFTAAYSVETEITIPNTVTRIPAGTLQNVQGFNTITFEEGGSDLTIENNAFAGSSVARIALPARLVSLGESAFEGCVRLTSVTFANGCTLGAIPASAFSGCTSLEAIAIPDSVTVINTRAFAGAGMSTVSFTANSHLETVADYAFVNSGLVSIVLPAGVKTLGVDVATTTSHVFEGCTALESVTFLGNAVTVIGASAFANLSSLETVNLGALTQLTAIGANAFQNSGIASITVPASVTSYGSSLFQGCTALTSATVNSSIPLAQNMFYGCSALSSVSLNANITSMGVRAFANCTSLDGIILPASLTTLGPVEANGDGSTKNNSMDVRVFEGCTALASITIPAGITEIHRYTFYGCTSLATVDFGTSKVTQIYPYAFYGCTALTSITLPETLLGIGYRAVTSADTGWDATYNNNHSYAFANTGLTSISIPGSVKLIGAYSFRGCTALKTLTFGQNASLIGFGNYSFDECANLETFTIPESVKHLGTGVLNGCSSLKTVTWNTSLSIPKNMFAGNTSLTSISLGNVSSIGESAFEGCTSLASISLNSEVLPTIGLNAFAGCTSLGQGTPDKEGFAFLEKNSGLYIDYWRNTASAGTEPVLELVSRTLISYSGTGETVQFDGDDENDDRVTAIADSAFNGNTSIKTVVIPESVTSIGASAFRYCSALESVTIPASVTSIGQYAFNTLASLEEVVYNAADVPDMTSSANVFGGTSGKFILTIGATVKRIPAYMFYNSNIYAIESVELKTANDDLTIRASAFYNCKSLALAELSSRVTSVGMEAFSGCTALRQVVFSDDGDNDDTNNKSMVLEDGSSYTKGVFYNCTMLKEVVLRAGITRIGKGTFYNCYVLTNIQFPAGLETIGPAAFVNCYGLITLTIPSSVTAIEGTSTSTTNTNARAFLNCYKLKEVINFSINLGDINTTNHGGIGTNAWSSFRINPAAAATYVSQIHKTEDGYLYAQNGTVVYLLGYTGMSSALALPESLTFSNGESSTETVEEYRVLSRAFYYDTSITSVIIPEAVTNIETNAFNGCSNLRTVINHSSINITKGTANGYVGYYATNSIVNDSGNTSNSSTKTVDGFTFYTVNGETKLMGYNGCESAITLPTSADVAKALSENNGSESATTLPTSQEVKVRYSIAAYAFCNNKTITRITIPAEAVTSIESMAFSDCSNLQEVIFTGKADGLVLEDGTGSASRSTDFVFYNCSSLKKVTFPEGLTKIGNFAFHKLATLTSVNIPSTVTSIGNYAFYQCKALDAEVELSDKITSIGNYAFNQCSLIDVVFPASVSSLTIGTCAFQNCTGIKNAILPEGVTSIGNSAFSGCSGLLSASIPSTVSSLGTCVFQNCSLLASVTLQNGVASISGNMFQNCTSLASITIPSSVTSIGGSAFSGCSALASIDLSHVTTLEGSAFQNCTSLAAVDVSNVTSFGTNVFYGCSSLASVTLPAEMTAIPSSMFYNCSSLASITLPSSVTSIGSQAFSGCTALTSINLAGITSIGSQAFEKCTALTSVVIPEGVTRIESSTFNGCTALESVTIPSTVTYIGSNAFQNCTALTSVVIPEGVASIGSSAFYNCTALTEIYYNATSCDNLNNWNGVFTNAGTAGEGITLYIGENVERLPNNLFYPYSGSNNPKLVSIVFLGYRVGDGGVMDFTIGTNALGTTVNGVNTIALESLYFHGTAEQLAYYGNTVLNSAATIYYYSETEPVGEGNYWHLVDGKVVVWGTDSPAA